VPEYGFAPRGSQDIIVEMKGLHVVRVRSMVAMHAQSGLECMVSISPEMIAQKVKSFL